MSWRARIALAWLLATFAGALWLAAAPGVAREESRTLSDGRAVAGHLVRAPSGPAASVRGLVEVSSASRRPLLAELLHGLAAEGGERLGLGPFRGARLGAALVAALLAAALSLLAFDLAGAAAAGLAPAVLLASPRLAALAPQATPDLLGALLWTLAVAAFLRSLDGSTRLARTRAGTAAGLLTGAAAAVRSDLWVLLPIFAGHWLLGRLHLWWLARRAATPAGLQADPEAAEAAAEAAPDEPAEDWAARLRRIPTAVGAAATLGPLLTTLAYPWLWEAPIERLWPALLTAHGLDGGAPGRPLLLLSAALPSALALTLGLGLAHAALRLLRALRGGDGRGVRTEALLLLAAGTPLALAAAGLAPRRDGLAPALHALPVLALLGARALASLARLAWPARRRTLAAALGFALLYPGLRSAVLTFPLGASAFGEAVGGAQGAASLGLARQDGGEAARSLLGPLGDHAVAGARVLWIGVAPEAVARYRRAGLLRADLADAAGPGEADLAVVARVGPARGEEYAAWEGLGSDRAEAGVYLDEVPLAQVFARRGAWR